MDAPAEENPGRAEGLTWGDSAAMRHPTLNEYRERGNADPDMPSLVDRFGVPPFSILDARQGYWQDIKRAWLAFGIESELGRDIGASGALFDSSGFADPLDRKNRSYDRKKLPAGSPTHPAYGKTFGTEGNISEQSGTSIFDATLCGLMYGWFCPPAGAVLDPFAGGSVRGIVAAKLGRNYTGIDLRPEQVAANEKQWARIAPLEMNPPPPDPTGTIRWIVGDGREAMTLAPGEYDFIFTCPPYGDLEVYSDNPRDLSNMPREKFMQAYLKTIEVAVALLKPNRFACFVVGNYRDKTDKHGVVRDLAGLTTAAFAQAGADLYNDIILVTAIGSLPIRAGKQFEVARKIGRTHQYILVYVKGDPRRATKAIGPPYVWAGRKGVTRVKDAEGQETMFGEGR